MRNVFFSTCAVAFRTTHGQNKTRKCDTEGFVPVASLYGVVGSPSSFIRSFIGKTRNDTESSDKSDSESIMTSEKDIENIDETEEFDDDLIITETLHDIRDGNQTHPNIDNREARLKIRARIKQKKSEWKGALRATHKMGKVLHRDFRTIVSKILQELTNFGEIYDTIVLNTLCKSFPILCVSLNAPFHCDFFCLIQSRILRRAFLLSMFGWV